MVILSFLGYLGEIESDSQTVWICICTIVPRSALPIFKSRFAVLDEIRLQGQFSCSWICMQSVGKVKYFSAFQYARRKNHRHHHWVKNDYNSRSDRTKSWRNLLFILRRARPISNFSGQRLMRTYSARYLLVQRTAKSSCIRIGLRLTIMRIRF